MIDHRQTGDDDGDEDPADLAPCELLDEYWKELQDEPGGTPRRWREGGHLREQRFFRDLGVLDLLNQLRASEEADTGSRASTMRLQGQVGLSPDPQAHGDVPCLAAADSDCEPRGRPSAGPAARTATATSPRRIGKYLVIELLDEGGQSRVYRVLHPELGKEFVLKLARRTTVKTSEADVDQAERSSLHREGRILAQCDHPNLVRVVDLDAHEGRMFMVMEHVPGLTLEQYAEQNRPGLRQSVRLVAELARAVSYLHGRGIVHQDIKPRNVLIDERGRPRLIDFGLARHKHAWSVERADAIGGTAVFMSPEQALGQDDRIGPRTDVFGLGGLLYYLLTLRPLYQGASRVSVQWQAMNADFIPIHLLNPRVPRSLEKVCRKSLAADPERRQLTALDLEHDLLGFLAWNRSLRIGIAAACVVAAGMFAVRLFAPRIVTAPTLQSASKTLTVEKLTIDHHGYRDGAWAWSIPVGLSGRPILEGDEASVSARLDAPAYAYLIALNPDGKVQLCLPPDPNERPAQSDEIRFAESTYFPFSDGPGLQVFVAVASRQPLPAFADWSGSQWLARNWRHIDAGDPTGVWRHDGHAATLVSSLPRGPLRKHPGPPPLFDEVCRQLAAVPGIDAIGALAFPVRPRESARPPEAGEGSTSAAR